MTAVTYINLADRIWESEGPARGLDAHREGIDFSRRRGLGVHNMWARTETTWMLYELGRWDELMRVADEVIGWDEARGGTQVTVSARTHQALVWLWRDQTARAASLAREVLPRARNFGDPQILVPALVVAALIEQASGDPSAAVGLIDEFEGVTKDRPPWRMYGLPDAVRILVAAASIEAAERLAQGLVPVPARHEFSVLTAQAVLTEASGELEAAAEMFTKAAHRWGEFGHVLEQGRAYLDVGRSLLALGRWTAATTSLYRARGIFAGIGADRLVVQADGLLATLPARSPS